MNPLAPRQAIASIASGSVFRPALRGGSLSIPRRAVPFTAPMLSGTAPGLRSRTRFASSFASSPVSSGNFSGSRRSQWTRPTTIVLIFVPILCGFLGAWQIKRLRWKVALIDEVERNLHREAMVLPGNVNLAALPDFYFRRILISGTLLPLPILLGPQVKEGVPGYSLIQPLARAKGSTILLNRGFITTTRAQAIRDGREGLPPGDTAGGQEVTLECMLMRPGEMGYWTHENKIETNEWFWRDVEGMARHAGGEGEGVQPVLVDVIDRGQTPATLLMQRGIPIGRPPQVELRNMHQSYAITWFSLSAATTVMLYFVLSKGRGGPKIDKRIRGL